MLQGMARDERPMIIFKRTSNPTPDESRFSQLVSAPLAGQLTGATSGLITNWLSLVKYQQYLQVRDDNFVRDIRKMMKSEGTFTRGLGATVLRDSIFGSAFTTLRVVFADEHQQFLVNLCSGAAASAIAGPLNYARNLQYSWSKERAGAGRAGAGGPPSIMDALRELQHDSIHDRRALWLKLRVGWGSLRVGIGMATGAYLYSTFLALLDGRGGGGDDDW